MPPILGRLLQTSRHFAAVGLVAVVVYANTLWCDFTFDDNFAVVCAHCFVTLYVTFAVACGLCTGHHWTTVY